MEKVLKEIILDFQEVIRDTGVPRQLEISSLPKKATVLIGVRRSGKSTYVYQHVERLIEEGVSRENIVYINFFDDRLHALQHDGLGIILEAYFSLYPHKKNTEKVYYFFDEIQLISGWESFVERLLRAEKCEVVLTGSSAEMLSKELATQMRGRALSWEIFPFSFEEYLACLGIAFDGPMTSKTRLLVQNAFEQYWETGAFPEVATLERSIRIKIHQEYFNAVLFRDMIERHDIPHPKVVSDLAHWLVDNTASLYSLNKLIGYLKSLGHTFSNTAISDYINWFEDAYFFFSVRLFDASIRRSNANPKKIYCIDHAMIRSVGSGVLVNSGHLLENLVYVTLRREASEIFYYRTKKGREVDFIVKSDRQLKELIQVCESLVDPNTKKREVQALQEAMEETGLKKGLIVTRNEEAEIQTPVGKITIIPIWKFLLKVDYTADGHQVFF